MIAYRCSCGQALEVGDELGGCKARCPKCFCVLVVPLSEPIPEAPSLPASDGASTISSENDITINPASK